MAYPANLPPLPPGFTLDPQPSAAAAASGNTNIAAASGLPPLPAGFKLDAPSEWRHAAQPKPPGFGAQLGSAVVRPIAKGVAALPLMAMDAGVAARNLIGDAANRALGRHATPDYELPSTTFNRALDTYTLPPSGVGKAAEFVSSSLVGGKVGVPEVEAAPPALRPDVSAARAQGYVLPPSQARPSVLNQLAEGLSGKIKTQQLASLKNQHITNGLVRKALGIKPGVPITVDALRAVRAQAGQAYAALRGIGEVNTDADYHAALRAIGEKYAGGGSFGRGGEHPVKALIDRLDNVSSFTGGDAINEIGLLREEAEKAAGQRDKGLATALRQAAGAIENQIDRHLTQSNAPASLVSAFRKSRELIGKSYSVQSALDRATDDVSAQKLSTQLARDKPLSGELKKVAEFGTAFPKSAQLPSKVGSVTNYSPLDFATMGIEGAAGLSTLARKFGDVF